MINIISAYYDELDVTDVIKSFIKNDKLSIVPTNDIFGDPKQFKVKKLVVNYKFNEEILTAYAYEGCILNIPENKLDNNLILLLTSCNRIKQVLLALTINSFIIKKPFHVIIADSSTPNVLNQNGVDMHNKEPYNHINLNNYCSDISLFNDIDKIKNVISHKIIHLSPRLEKVQGDATLITLGLSQAALIGNDNAKNNYCLKLSGVAILREDILSDLPTILENYDAMTFHRSHFGHGEYSSRVFAGRPEVLASATLKAGWKNWINPQSGDTEFRLADILNGYLNDRVLYTKKDEFCLLDNGGCHKDALRINIKNHIINNNIPLEIPIIKEFMDGGVW